MHFVNFSGADSIFRQSQRLFALSNAHASAAARPALSQFRDLLSKQITGIKDAGTYKMERIITSSQSTEITVEGTQKRILNFCANNYLGLAVCMLDEYLVDCENIIEFKRFFLYKGLFSVSISLCPPMWIIPAVCSIRYSPRFGESKRA